MLRIAKNLTKFLGRLYIERINTEEFANQSFGRFNERPVEFGFVFRKLAELYPRTVLDVGTGTTALPSLIRNCGCLVTATDNVRDYWPSGMTNRHYCVIDDDITATKLTGNFDLVTCVSVLEHITEPDAAVKNMISLLNPGGHLILTFPYSETTYVRNVYELPGSSYGRGLPYITQSYSRLDLDRWLASSGAKISDQEYWQCWSGNHWTVGEQVIPPRKVSIRDRHQLTCVLIERG